MECKMAVHIFSGSHGKWDVYCDARQIVNAVSVT
jgi:hypothetical protein